MAGPPLPSEEIARAEQAAAAPPSNLATQQRSRLPARGRCVERRLAGGGGGRRRAAS